MNKKILSYLFIIIALILGAMYYNKTIQSPLITSLNTLKSIYQNSLDHLYLQAQKYLLQARAVEELSEKLKNFENNHLVMQQLASEIQDLYEENKSTLKLNPKVSLVRTLSYQEFGNFNRVWLEVADYNSSRVYGLTYKDLVAGIVINKDSKPLALLNRDIKSAYAVYVGEHNAPGIAHGNNDAKIVVSFIPSWYEIAVGDEVLTSGLDKIFFKGLKVGRVVSLTKTQGYQNAVVEPYYKSDEINYFHMIKDLR